MRRFKLFLEIFFLRKISNYQRIPIHVSLSVFLTLNFPRLVLGLIEVTKLRTVEYCYEENKLLMDKHQIFALSKRRLFDIKNPHVKKSSVPIFLMGHH